MRPPRPTSRRTPRSPDVRRRKRTTASTSSITTIHAAVNEAMSGARAAPEAMTRKSSGYSDKVGIEADVSLAEKERRWPSSRPGPGRGRATPRPGPGDCQDQRARQNPADPQASLRVHAGQGERDQGCQPSTGPYSSHPGRCHPDMMDPRLDEDPRRLRVSLRLPQKGPSRATKVR